METPWEIEMFKKKFKDLTTEELDFITEANYAASIGNNGFDMAEKYKVLASFYLAKQIEQSNISNDKHSKAMKWLTYGLVFIGAVQAASGIISIMTQ